MAAVMRLVNRSTLTSAMGQQYLALSSTAKLHAVSFIMILSSRRLYSEHLASSLDSTACQLAQLLASSMVHLHSCQLANVTYQSQQASYCYFKINVLLLNVFVFVQVGVRAGQALPEKVKIVEVGPRDGLQNEKVTLCQRYVNNTAAFVTRAFLRLTLTLLLTTVCV